MIQPPPGRLTGPFGPPALLRGPGPVTGPASSLTGPAGPAAYGVSGPAVRLLIANGPKVVAQVGHQNACCSSVPQAPW